MGEREDAARRLRGSGKGAHVGRLLCTHRPNVTVTALQHDRGRGGRAALAAHAAL